MEIEHVGRRKSKIIGVSCSQSVIGSWQEGGVLLLKGKPLTIDQEMFIKYL